MQQAKKFEFYIVFMDDKSNYLTAYGYDHSPVILDFKYAIESLSTDEEIKNLIPDFEKILDYICFKTMGYSEFVRYIESQEHFEFVESENN